MLLTIASITTLAEYHHASCGGNLLYHWWYLLSAHNDLQSAVNAYDRYMSVPRDTESQ